MEIFKINNLSFAYPGAKKKAIENINLDVNEGEFILICGKSGCGKTTLLRCLKKELTPHGDISGSILYRRLPLSELPDDVSTCEIGFVMQDPDNQIVTDKVWHELAFGLEGMGLPPNTIRRRVAEISGFLGIQSWFGRSTHELSGGQKQMLSLAGVLVMQPKALILDEPTSQLDPIAATEFFETIKKINSELAITVIICEQRLEEVFPMADRVIIMDGGKIISDSAPDTIEAEHPIQEAFPAAMRIYRKLGYTGKSPITVKEGRQFIDTQTINRNKICKEEKTTLSPDISLEMQNVWFKYDSGEPDVLKGTNLTAYKGEFLCLVGANAAGKTTALSVAAGIYKPYRGIVKILGKKLGKYKNTELYNGIVSLLPQQPQALFVQNTVENELKELSEDIKEVVSLTELEGLLSRHPFDLSGGEQQKLAFAKILLKNPEIILLDEPTKGLDAVFKKEFGRIIKTLTDMGKTIIMATHDLEFAARNAHRCAMFFDGTVISHAQTNTFFSENNYYTTGANRIIRHICPGAITVEDVVNLCKKEEY